MSELPETNQERPQGSWEQDQGVDQSRRKLAKIGAAAPVIMTLASKPVFGAQCLSQMMSGNASVDVTGSCALGTSPGGLSKLQGETVTGASVSSAWAAAGFAYADKYDALSHEASQNGHDGYLLIVNGNKNQAEDYIGGTLVRELPSGFSYTGDTNTPIRLVLDNSLGYKDNELRHVLTAYINAFSVPNYVLTPDQVIGLKRGAIPIPEGLSLTDFLAATW